MSADRTAPGTDHAPVYLNVGVTGHRDLVPEELPRLEAQVRKFLLQLKERCPGLELQMLSPLAEGSDRLAANVAVALDIPLLVVLPMDQADYERDFAAPESLAEFRKLLASARTVIHLPTNTPDPKVSEITPQTRRDRLYAQAGVFISNHSQVLLALWDGKASEAVGGTSQVVRYHLTALMDGFEDQLNSAELLADNENDLAYHLVCSRSRPDGTPEPGLDPQGAYWLTSLHGRTAAPHLPTEYFLMLNRLNEFAEDRALRGWDGRSGDGLPQPGPKLPPLPDSAKFVLGLFGRADRLAIHYQRWVNRSLFAIHGLAILMGLVFIIYTEYSVPRVLLWVFLALFFSGLVIHVTGRRREWHRKYLDYRGLAEALRVQYYWNLSGVADPDSVGFVFENFLQKQDVELGWIRHVMRSASLQRVRGSEPDEAWVPWVIEQWVGVESEGSGQLAYYSRKEVVNAIKLRRTERLGTACLWASIAFAVLLGLAGDWLIEGQQQFLLVLIGLLPLVAGVSDSISHKRAEKELIRQYHFMARIFGNARRLLDEPKSIAFQRRVLKALGDAALEEGAEWILMHRTRPLEPQGLG